jgi:ComF family protein
MHPLRQMARGYNQAEALAKIAARISSLPISTTLLKRNSMLKQQVKTRSRTERLKNQHNAFSVLLDVTGKDFILIDDVTTTGATLLSARKALIDKGAKNVWAVTIAH